MDNTYKKNKGNAGLEGVQFQLNLLTVCLLNALRSRTQWKISTENSQAGKYDDIVIELPDETVVLVQAKHKQKQKITKEQLLSVNSKKSDFSLPKYFFSYEDIKNKFKKMVVIICSNTFIDDKGLEDILTFQTADPSSTLYFRNGSCSFFTFNEKIVPDLKKTAEMYLDRNLKGKNFDKTVITKENIKDFLSHLQFFSNYPSEDELHKIIDQLLSGLKDSSLWSSTSSHDVYKKIEDWFKQPKGEYLTEFRAKAMFCEIKSDKYYESLKNFNISFAYNNFNFTHSRRIFHITAEGVCLLQVLKIYHALQDNRSKKLYANPSEGMEVQKHVIEAFELNRYAFLIIIWSRITQGTLIKEIGDKLRDILEKSPFKKVILVGEGNNILAQHIGLADTSKVDGSITFKDLSKSTQKRLLKNNNIEFQGTVVCLEQLLRMQTLEDYAKFLSSEMLDHLIRKEVVKVGVKLLDLDEDVACYYIPRRFERTDNEIEMRRCEFPEEGIFSVNEKVLLISDGAGTGKSTVLTKLAVILKEKHPYLWIIKINLNDYTGILKDSLKNGTISVTKLLDSEESTKLNNQLEKLIFSLKEKVVLMLDAVDEVSPDYTNLILDMIAQSQKAPNFAKIFVTTRPHMTSELEAVLKVGSFKMLPFTEHNQIDFLTRYWAYNLQLTDYVIKRKCEKYAKTLTTKIYSLVAGLYWGNEFAEIPLLVRMIGEIFQENVRQHLNGISFELKLPEKFMAQLYDTFIERKKDIFIEKGNPTGNVAANQALNDQFEECLAHHRSLALKVILSETERNLFASCHQDIKDMAKHMLKLGIVQQSGQDFEFNHRTFAEYFVASSIIKELQQFNQNAEFQRLLIDEILLKTEYKIVRAFFDSFLQKVVDSLPPDIFENYYSSSDAWISKENIIFILSNEGCLASLRLILKSIDFQASKDRVTGIKHMLTDLELNLDEEAEINIRNKDGDMPLHVAIKKGHLDMVRLLIERGADVLTRDSTGRPALHLLAERGELDAIKFLITCGVDVNIREMCGRTALYLATLNGYLDTAKYLVEWGGDLNITGRDGRTPLHLVAGEDNFDIVQYFRPYGSPFSC